jgi:hypothetical protein
VTVTIVETSIAPATTFQSNACPQGHYGDMKLRRNVIDFTLGIALTP